MIEKTRNKKQKIKWAINALTEIKNNFLDSFESVFDLDDSDIIFLKMLNREIKGYQELYNKLKHSKRNK